MDHADTDTTAGTTAGSFRVAHTPRKRDRATGVWSDGQTLWFSVSCWRTLAEHCARSLSTGDRVVVTGRLRAPFVGHASYRSFAFKTTSPAAPGPGAAGNGLSGQRQGGGGPGGNGRIGADALPAGRAYHPRALRSMFSATSVMKTAKMRLSGLGSSAWASLAPRGAVISVIAITRKKAGRLTAPRL